MFLTRKLNSASPHYLDCFSVEDLVDYITGKIAPEQRKKVFNHLNLEKCGHCRKLYLEAEIIAKNRNSEAETVAAADDFFTDPERLEWLMQRKRPRKTPPPLPKTLGKGQIWTTSQRIVDHTGKVVDTVKYAYPVMIVDAGSNCGINPENVIRVVPISVDTEFVHPGHSLELDRKHLHYAAIIEVFNEKPMLAVNLKEYRSNLTSAELADYSQTRMNFVEGKTETPDVEVELWEKKELQLTEYLSHPVNVVVKENGRKDNIVKFPMTSSVANSDVETVAGHSDVCNLTPVIELYQYQLAAADDDIFVPESAPDILYSSPTLKIAVIQRRNSIFCQILVGDRRTVEEPIVPVFTVDGQPQDLTEKYPQVYEVKLGEVGQVPQKLELICSFGELKLTFTACFKVTAKEYDK